MDPLSEVTGNTPESEQNKPTDRKIGFKPWNDTQDRWWMGNQWGETYRDKE